MASAVSGKGLERVKNTYFIHYIEEVWHHLEPALSSVENLAMGVY